MNFNEKRETTQAIAATSDTRKAQDIGDAYIATLKPWEQARIARSRTHLATDTYEKAGALYWTSVDRPVPVDVFEDAFVPVPSGQQVACTTHNDVWLAEYRKQQANHCRREVRNASSLRPR